MSSKKGGARRPCTSRIVTLTGALMAMFALAILTSGAGAASKCEQLSKTAYADPAGDGMGAGAPDITEVVVGSWEDGTTKFEIALPDRSEMAEDMLVRAYLDTDKNVQTGNAKGFEYMIQVQRRSTLEQQSFKALSPSVVECEEQPVASLYKWEGEAWVKIEKVDGLASWYGDERLTLQLKPAAVGNAIGFNFAVYAASGVVFDVAGTPVLTAAASDWAPDEGTWVYQPFDYSTYGDAAGDAGGAPDITKIVVTKWRGGLFKFWIEIPGTKTFAQDMLVEAYVDADSNRATGDPGGYEYVLRAQPVPHEETPAAMGKTNPGYHSQLSMSVRVWDGSEWIVPDCSSLSATFDRGLKFAIDPGKLGNPTAFTFYVAASSGVVFDAEGGADLTNAVTDRAPDTGSYGFPLQVASAQLLGSYKVRYKITKARNFSDLKRGKAFTKTWKFVQNCKKKNCVTRVVVSGGKEKFKLARKGKATYKAKAGRKFACEAGMSAKGTQKLQLRVKKGAWVKGKWRVAKWTGTVNVVSPANGVAQCGGAASYSAALAAKRK